MSKEETETATLYFHRKLYRALIRSTTNKIFELCTVKLQKLEEEYSLKCPSGTTIQAGSDLFEDLEKITTKKSEIRHFRDEIDQIQQNPSHLRSLFEFNNDMESNNLKLKNLFYLNEPLFSDEPFFEKTKQKFENSLNDLEEFRRTKLFENKAWFLEWLKGDF
jgi:hypothetical protein